MKTQTTPAAILTRIATRRTRIMVIGDVMLDRFSRGHVSRISPEAPVPILLRDPGGDTHMPGGAANVARNLAHLGCRVMLCGVTGTGDAASVLKAAIADEPAITYRNIAVPGRRTTLKTRFIAAGEQMLRVDDEDVCPLPPKAIRDIIAWARAHIAKAGLLILSDYDKGVIGAEVAQKIIALARKHKVPVLVDPKKPDMKIWRGAQIITPNLAEARMILGNKNAGRDAIAKGMGALCKKHGIASALVTLGSDGMVLIGANTKSKPRHIKAVAREVFDVSGAGDTVIAALAAAIAAGASHEDAGAFANVAAGIVVGKHGTATASPGAILAATASASESHPEAAMKKITQWRKKNLTIGFTNGCFDMLHPGHIALLEKAAAHCDRLVVGLNGDDSVRRLKGAGRPLQNVERRAAALAALPAVDAVAVFDEATPARLIAKIKPHRLIKGGDYDAKNIVGAKQVAEAGGKVIIVPLVQGYSTTRLNKS